MKASQTPPDDRRSRRLLLLPLLIFFGLGLGWLQPYEVDDLLRLGRELSGHPGFLLAVVIGMAVLFSFGLPGSFAVWLIAPFQPPWLATLMLVTGSVIGAFGAYRVSARLRGDWRPDGFGRRVLDLLSQHGGWLTQTALRVLPGFPHSVVNFAGGALGLGLARFLAAALVGLSIKWAVYASAIHGLVEAVESEQALSAATLLPLLVLSALLIAGGWARYRLLSARDRSS